MNDSTTNHDNQGDLDGDRYGLVADYRTDGDEMDEARAHPIHCDDSLDSRDALTDFRDREIRGMRI